MSKEINILAFGITRDIVNGDSFAIKLPGDCSVEELKAHILEAYPELKKLKSLFIAVNNEYGDDTHKITGKEEVALIPPVSGG